MSANLPRAIPIQRNRDCTNPCPDQSPNHWIDERAFMFIARPALEVKLAVTSLGCLETHESSTKSRSHVKRCASAFASDDRDGLRRTYTVGKTTRSDRRSANKYV